MNPQEEETQAKQNLLKHCIPDVGDNRGQFADFLESERQDGWDIGVWT